MYVEGAQTVCLWPRITTFPQPVRFNLLTEAPGSPAALASYSSHAVRHEQSLVRESWRGAAAGLPDRRLAGPTILQDCWEYSGTAPLSYVIDVMGMRT